MTRSKLVEQIKYVACGDSAFAKGTAETAMIVTSTSGKKLQTSDNAASGFIDLIGTLDSGVNWVDLCTAKAYLKTNDSSAVAVLGDFGTDPVAQSQVMKNEYAMYFGPSKNASQYSYGRYNARR